jgi:hypothetical protein
MGEESLIPSSFLFFASHSVQEPRTWEILLFCESYAGVKPHTVKVERVAGTWRLLVGHTCPAGQFTVFAREADD